MDKFGVRISLLLFVSLIVLLMLIISALKGDLRNGVYRHLSPALLILIGFYLGLLLIAAYSISEVQISGST